MNIYKESMKALKKRDREFFKLRKEIENQY